MRRKIFQLFAAICFCISACLVRGAEDNIDVDIDGKPVPVQNGSADIPSSAEVISFRIRPSKGAENSRIQFRLEGVDGSWRKGAGEMYLTAKFFDQSGDQVGQEMFPVTGESPGWTGDIGTSQFAHRRETLKVPSRAERLWVVISSAGPPATIGFYAVTDLLITRPPDSEVIFQMPSLNASEEVPTGWVRDGTHPSMAKVVALRGSDSLGAFGVVDDDLSSHAEWHLVREFAPRVTPGEVLNVEWNEVYDIGIGGVREVSYSALRAGRYRFVVSERSAMGQALGADRVIALNVKLPIWQSIWFWIPMLLLAVGLVAFATRAILRVRMRSQIERIQQDHMVESERLRIARDLHDDLGARLTHISLVSAMAESEAITASSRASIERISVMARELVAVLYETVWSVNPENDRLESLVNFLCQLGQKLCEPTGMRCRIRACDVPSERMVSSELRHHTTLAVKEAIHNAIKHSGSKEFELRMSFADSVLEIIVEDQGSGFQPGTEEGNGSGNMRRRMEIVAGTVETLSVPGSGTRVRFTIPIP